MDPLYEQRLRDEVIFLHSLWHQGPPRPAASAAVTAATSTSTSARYHLQPSKPTNFKKKHTTPKILPDSASSDGVEWPCPATPPPNTAWPTGSGPTSHSTPLSPQEQSKLVSRLVHQHALKVVRELFTSYDSDGSDEIGSSGDDDEEDEEAMDGDEKYSILEKVFEDFALKEYYEKNFAMGEFSCLVCGAVGGKNMGKKFKGCLPLVQHSIAIEKTKRRGAHRAFAQAVCKVLGWDIDCLNAIGSMLSEKPGNEQGNGNGDKEESAVAIAHNVDSAKDDCLDGGKDGEAGPESDAGKNMEEPASDGLLTSFSACNDADITEIRVPSGGDVSVVSTSAVRMEPSEAAWPCPSPPHLPSTSDRPTTSWTTLEKPNLKAVLPSAEEQSVLAARHAHQHAMKVVDEFFRTTKSDNSAEIGSDSDDDDDDDEQLMEEDSGSESYTVFFKVFEEGTELKEYYVKNFAQGVLSCLVCETVGGKKSGKKYKGCLPLVQHSITIAKTKNRRAHRAFGQAVCKVLGWDINRLPEVASMLSDKTGATQISVTCTDANNNLENHEMLCEQSTEKPASQEMAINSSVHPDADKVENLGMEHQHNGQQPASEGPKIVGDKMQEVVQMN